MTVFNNPKFSIGNLVSTPGAMAAFPPGVLTECLQRHVNGDWGDLSSHDRKANDEALKTDERIFSSYVLEGGKKLWIITEADRSVTTFLLPEEY